MKAETRMFQEVSSLSILLHMSACFRCIVASGVPGKQIQEYKASETKDSSDRIVCAVSWRRLVLGNHRVDHVQAQRMNCGTRIGSTPVLRRV